MEEELKQSQNLGANLVKVVFFGPESTGKSLLSEALAAHYHTVFVPEYSRVYAESKVAQNKMLTKADVLDIAAGQMQNENAELKNANKLLICDTDLLETKVYSEYYYDGFCPSVLKRYAVENSYDLYFLCYIDTHWEADGIRDRPEHRLELFKRFEKALQTHNKPYVTLKGSFEEKRSTCIRHIDQLLKQKT
ncbi:AAA family ATPase [Sediminibacter sp. Hel_I_10]|uniref:AAA family ATPase n=1 Tax=Sediminibacter sp. Hel_I_10 TaxID=1392490 RepID=UPI00047BE1FA|nr:ATP-binding protein [Sediminibacter sp. Hel_I_10]